MTPLVTAGSGTPTRIGQLALFVTIGLADIGLVTEAFGNVLDGLANVWSEDNAEPPHYCIRTDGADG